MEVQAKGFDLEEKTAFKDSFFYYCLLRVRSMIDTVIFRIHDLDKHNALVKFLDKQGLEGTSIKVKQYDSEVDQSEYFQKKIHMKRIFHDYNSGKTKDFAYRNHLKSYHHDLAYTINFQGTSSGFIEFNFSIPKYLFGTNVFQFVPHYFDKNYVQSRFASFEQMQDVVYDDLRKFLEWFFKKELGGLVNEYFVQIIQMDICYNKVFNTDQDARVYLRDLLMQRKKYLRNKDGNMGMWDTSAMYTSKASGYAWKIYHKGDEFKVHDRLKLLKAGYEEAFVNKLHDLANRMIRYEASFRTKYMSNLFKDFIFRKGQDEWERARKYYRKISSEGYIKVKGVKLALAELDRFRKKCYKYGQFYDGKVFHFHLQSDSDFFQVTGEALHQFETGKFTFTPDDREQRFSRKLFHRMVASFLKYKKEFTISNLNTFAQLLNDMQISSVKGTKKKQQHFKDWLWQHKQYNVGKDLSFNKVNEVATHLRIYGWEELLTRGIVQKRTFYRVRKFFRDIGMENPASIMVVAPDEKRGAFMEYQTAIESIVTNYYVKRFIRPF